MAEFETIEERIEFNQEVPPPLAVADCDDIETSADGKNLDCLEIAPIPLTGDSDNSRNDSSIGEIDGKYYRDVNLEDEHTFYEYTSDYGEFYDNIEPTISAQGDREVLQSLPNKLNVIEPLSGGKKSATSEAVPISKFDRSYRQSRGNTGNLLERRGGSPYDRIPKSSVGRIFQPQEIAELEEVIDIPKVDINASNLAVNDNGSHNPNSEKLSSQYARIPQTSVERAAKAEIPTGKYAEFIVWQCYSTALSEKIISKLRAGQLTARMNMVEMYDLINASDEFQSEVIGRTYSQERSILQRDRKIVWLFSFVNLALSAFILKDYSPFYILVISYLLYKTYNQAKVDSKGSGIYVMWWTIWFCFLLWQWDNPGLIVLATFSAVNFALPYVMFNKLRKTCLNFLLEDRLFFRHVTGRSHSYSSRKPQVCISQKKMSLLEAIPWDINPKPVLLDLQVDAPYPTVIGIGYDFYFSNFEVQVIALGIAFVVGASNTSIWPVILLLSLGLSLLYAFACPSQKFVAYRRICEENGGTREFDVALRWALINFVWTFICLFAWSTIVRYSLPIVLPNLETKLDIYFPHWRSILNFLVN